MKLWQQVILGLALGVGAGFALGESATDLKILGTIFINLIKMVMVPLVFFALVSGITSLGESGNVKRVGLKSVLAYLSTAVFAVCIGLACATFFQPGAGLDFQAFLNHNGVAAAAPVVKEPPKLTDTLLGIIPTNAIGAMAEGNILQVVVFAMFTGAMLNATREKSQKVIDLAHEMATVTFKMIETVVKLAPFGVFGFIAATVGTQGVDVLVSLGKLIEAVLVACLSQYVIFGLLILVFGELNPLPFYKKMITTQTMAFSTSSSKATLSTAMRELHEKLGVSQHSTKFVLPLGAAINMDGTAIYLGICAIFFAQATGTALGVGDYLTIILTSTIASIGAAGIPSGSLIFMGMVLSSVGLPIEGIALIAGVDRILDMFRTTINITGDSAITLIIDKTEGHLNTETYYHGTKHAHRGKPAHHAKAEIAKGGAAHSAAAKKEERRHDREAV